jgi:hypothetical protein
MTEDHPLLSNQFVDPVRKRILIASLIAKIIGNMMNQIIISFQPTYIVQRQEEDPLFIVKASDIALIISIFSVALLVFASLNSAIKNTLGTKNTIVIG